ncbi:bifunctional DNA primase/polymerase [Microbacterium sp. HA-8]|uniref:bifunctional DNA primase/polymerase n=1 Tax=Microbacterium sp. HA-8 TaxID=3234200 RepID=UPI0038F7BEA4
MAELEFPAATAALPAAAVHYARHGLRVFPCVPKHKRPMTENGFKDATTSVGVDAPIAVKRPVVG